MNKDTKSLVGGLLRVSFDGSSDVDYQDRVVGAVLDLGLIGIANEMISDLYSDRDMYYKGISMIDFNRRFKG